MRHDILAPALHFHDDQSLVVLGIGRFGLQVVRILGVEFERLRVPRQRLCLLGIGTESEELRHALATRLVDCLTLEPFDATEYLMRPEHETLRQALQHLDGNQQKDLGRFVHPHAAAGLLALHRYDDVIVPAIHATLERRRAENPQGGLHCVVVAGMGDSLGAGMTLPLLERLRDAFLHHKVKCDLLLVTPESASTDAGAALEHNAAASADAWNDLLSGRECFVYPGRAGARDDLSSASPVQQYTWIFSGGTQRAIYSESALASIVASCISVQVLTPLGTTLERECARHGDEGPEAWVDATGVRYATALLNVNVGGLKLDCLPSLMQLRSAERFLTTVTRALSDDEATHLQTETDRFLEELRLKAECVIDDLELAPPLPAFETIRDAGVPAAGLQAYIRSQLDNNIGQLLRMADGRQLPAVVFDWVERVRKAVTKRCLETASQGNGYLSAAVLMLRTLERRLEEKRQQVEARAAWARSELGNHPNVARLEALLERLQQDIAASPPDDDPTSRFGKTNNIALPIQIRKILQVADEIRQHAIQLGTAHVLVHAYDGISRHALRLREELQGTSYALARAAALCRREEEYVHRAARSALTYQRGRSALLLERLFERLEATLPARSPSELLSSFASDLVSLGSDEDVLGRLLPLLRPELGALAHAVNDALCHEPAVQVALQESLNHFAPNLQVDRVGCPDLQTVRERWVVCTRQFFESHHEGLLDGYRLVETENPFNVFLVHTEDGLPFAAVSYLQQARAELTPQGLDAVRAISVDTTAALILDD